jgi:hypothetical protein
VILLTLSIYIRAGRTILESRKQLREFNRDLDFVSVDGDEDAAIERIEITVTTGTTGDGTHLGPMARHDTSCGDSSVRILACHICPGTDVMLPIHSNTMYEQTSAVQLAPPRPQHSTRRNAGRRHRYEVKSAAWSYTKCALLYFSAILITWIPSSANRVYSLVHGGDTFAPLALMSAFVLPLQGFWNWLIYIVISWAACKDLFQDIKIPGLAVSEMTASMSGANLTASSHQRRRNLPRSSTTARSSRTNDCETVTDLSGPTEGQVATERLNY